ncbi:MAG: hypothetical protein AAF847_03215 [Bacteroidota bacterium]
MDQAETSEVLSVDYETDETLTEITPIAADDFEEKAQFWKAVKPIRKNVSLEQILEEQNYKPIDREEFFNAADDLNIEEPLDELLAMLTP